MLLPWQPALNVSDIFAFPGLAEKVQPLIFVVNGTIQKHATMKVENWGILNYALGYWSPIMEEISQSVFLPDLALLLNPADGPIDPTTLPFVGSCQLRRRSIAVTWPYSLNDAKFNNITESRAGPGDARIGKAIFRGSPVGWINGRRRAIMLAGQYYPELVDAGLASLSGCGQCGDVRPDELARWLKPMISMENQTQTHKYVATADGNCISHRMKDWLSSDCAVFWVQSYQEEWYYPLLVPMKHYFPVQYDQITWPGEHIDLASMVGYAQHNPEIVANVVREAKAFARFHLSRRGQTCFVVRFLQRYHEVLRGLENLEALIDASGGVLNVEPATSGAPATASEGVRTGMGQHIMHHIRKHFGRTPHRHHH